MRFTCGSCIAADECHRAKASMEIKKCFAIQSLVGKDEPVRPTALRFSESIRTSPFGSCFQNFSRTLYSSSPELMFTDPACHSSSSGLSLRPLQPFFSHQRETLSFYPCRYLQQRLHSEDSTPENLLLHSPFSRKPKRIRTAFSPSQLLRLEDAFEKNHYVVGGERKQLANRLCLTEAQVKVWFQNKRMKHKRQKLEEECPDSQQKRKDSQHVSRWRMATQQSSSEDTDVISED